MKFLVLTDPRSKSGKAIAGALGVKRTTVARLQNRRKPFRGTVINWGVVDPPVTCVNHNTRVAADKVDCLWALSQAQVPCLEFALGKGELADNLAEGRWKPTTTVFARTLLNASGGKGIKIHTASDRDLPDCELYTKYFPKVREWRVHVVHSVDRGTGYFVQLKKRRRDLPASETLLQKMVRNHSNGWIYTHNLAGVEEFASKACSLACEAVSSLGLNLGAVDILEDKNGKMVVCEVNTRPGIESPRTLEFYREHITSYFINARLPEQ